MADYGRNRESMADIQERLNELFSSQPDCQFNEDGEPVVPGSSLVDIMASFGEQYGGGELMAPDEIEKFQVLLSTVPDLAVTPAVIMGFIAAKTKQSPPSSPTTSESPQEKSLEREDDATVHRSISSSIDTMGHNDSPNLSFSGDIPQTPKSSVFDTTRRQRTTPLANQVPSSYKRPVPHRRKSDAGNRSDSEDSPSFNRATSRSRAPSNPTSPNMPNFDRIGSPPYSRPHSRAQSQPHNIFNSSSFRDYSSSELDDHESFTHSINSLSMPNAAPDSDEEDEEDLIRFMNRSTASSTVSLEMSERLEALQRVNDELQRKLQETESTLLRKLSEAESEIEDMTNRVEELRSELLYTKREEKELRAKDRSNTNQVAALEAEIQMITRQLEVSRTSYQALNKQYTEQCTASEKYRDDLRQREEQIRSLMEQQAVAEAEQSRSVRVQQSYEDRIARLESDLTLAQEAHAQLDEQKQENLMLKETIDRMRFEMDDMRQSAASGGPVGGNSSAPTTISKSLGAELLGKMKGAWEMEEAEVEEEESSSNTDGDDTEGEDVIQTIITRKKRKVVSRANKIETRTYEEVREYSDSSTQHDIHEFSTASSTQTLPEHKILTASINIQTDESPMPEPEPVEASRATVDVEIQTDEVEVKEPENSRSPSPETSETMASSSSTILPPTPKPHLHALDSLVHHDQPPAYTQSEEQVAEEILKKWHPADIRLPMEGIPGGVSENALMHWKALKDELGVDCHVIEKILENSKKNGPRPESEKDSNSKPHKGRFYNIYNTYIFGARNAPSVPSNVAANALMVLCISAIVIGVVGPQMVPHYAIPGGPTYSDRVAWNSFNTLQAAGEGFGGDGTTAVWSFLGRVGGGAARMARGWPT